MNLIELLTGYPDVQRLVYGRLTLECKRTLSSTCKSLYWITRKYVYNCILPRPNYGARYVCCMGACRKERTLNDMLVMQCGYGHTYYTCGSHVITEISSTLCPKCAQEPQSFYLRNKRLKYV